MLTTKYRIAEQALRIITGGNPTDDNEVSVRELIVLVSQAFATIVKRTYFEGRNEGEQWINGNFIYTFRNITVTEDKSRGVFFSEIPESSVTLPYNMQIYQVGPLKETSPAYVPMMAGQSELLRGLDAGDLQGRIGYYLENSRVYYTATPANAPKEVMMKIVAPIGSVGDEDEIDISNDIQLEIVQLAVQLYSTEQASPKDTLNDMIK